jgi:hypothetical protein
VSKINQPNSHSAIEAITNTVVGFLLSILAQYLVYPFYNIPFTFEMTLEIAIIFTALSLLRSYFLRRLFNKFH